MQNTTAPRNPCSLSRGVAWSQRWLYQRETEGQLRCGPVYKPQPFWNDLLKAPLVPDEPENWLQDQGEALAGSGWWGTLPMALMAQLCLVGWGRYLGPERYPEDGQAAESVGAPGRSWQAKCRETKTSVQMKSASMPTTGAQANWAPRRGRHVPLGAASFL